VEGWKGGNVISGRVVGWQRCSIMQLQYMSCRASSHNSPFTILTARTAIFGVVRRYALRTTVTEMQNTVLWCAIDPAVVQPHCKLRITGGWHYVSTPSHTNPSRDAKMRLCCDGPFALEILWTDSIPFLEQIWSPGWLVSHRRGENEAEMRMAGNDWVVFPLLLSRTGTRVESRASTLER
jgi:hypothetical protein